MNFHSIQIASYSLKVKFRKDDRHDFRGNEIELL